MSKIEKIRIWWMAYFQNYPFFRVVYKDGKKTIPLYYSEANGLKETFNGKLIIDYEYGEKYLKN